MAASAGPLSPNEIVSRQWRNSPDDRIWSALEDWFALTKDQEKSKLKESVAAKAPLSEWTIVHFACAHNAPPKLVHKMLEFLPDAISWIDSEGRTPLHLACENGASPELADVLVSEAANGSNADASLLEAVDNLGRTPMHVVLDHATLKESAVMLELLLEKSCEPKGIQDKAGRFPLSCLKKFHPEGCSKEEIENIEACFGAYIASVQIRDAKSDPKDPDLRFFSLFDELPWWLWERAASSTTMQTKINETFCSGAVAQLLVTRLLSLIIILVVLPLVWSLYFEEKNSGITNAKNWLLPYTLLAGAFGLLMEKGLPMFIRACHGNIFCRLQRHPSELIYVLLGVYTLVISIVMLKGTVQDGSPFSSGGETIWRALTVVAIAMTSWALVAFFRLVSVDFAQITNGVVLTVKKIMAFMLAFTIVLIAFAEMLYISTSGTDECARQSDFCDFFDALLKVYTMSVGEVSEDDIPKNGFSVFLYVVFVYAVVILLANVLAFIIGNDIWSKEQTSRDFWLNRLNHLVEVWTVFASKNKELTLCGRSCQVDLCCEVDCSVGLSKSWQKLISIFDDKGLGTLSPMFWLTMVLRLLSAFAIFLWIGVAGLFFLGTFWPLEVRKFLFWVSIDEEKERTTTKQSALIEPAPGARNAEAELRQVQMDMSAMEEKLSNEIKTMEEKLSKLLTLLENQQKPSQTQGFKQSSIKSEGWA